jgi:hypothetical protein
MTMVRPCRLITRQRSHMGFTEGLTFIQSFLTAGDRAHRQTPRSAGRHGTRTPESVRILGPAAVTATVCSKWAESEPSEVEIDHSSSCT